MLARVTTTITTYINLDSLKIDGVEVDVEADDPLPQNLVLASVEGSLKSALKKVQEQQAGDERKE